MMTNLELFQNFRIKQVGIYLLAAPMSPKLKRETSLHKVEGKWFPGIENDGNDVGKLSVDLFLGLLYRHLSA